MTIDSLRYAAARDAQLIRLSKLLAPTANEYVIERTVSGVGKVFGGVMFDAIVEAASKVSRADAQKYMTWLTKSNYMAWMADANQIEPLDQQGNKKPDIVSKFVNGVEMSPMWVTISVGLMTDSVPCETLRARVVLALSKIIEGGK